MKPETELSDTTLEGPAPTAITRLRTQADVRVHLMIYIAVNVFLVEIWAMSGPQFFWPIFPIVGWGVGVAANAWDADGRDQLTEVRIQREITRMQR